MATCKLRGPVDGPKTCEVCGRTGEWLGPPERWHVRCGVDVVSGPTAAAVIRLAARPTAAHEAAAQVTGIVEPSAWKKAKSLAAAAAAHAADGFAHASATEIAARLSVCDVCAARRGNWCTACGCNLAIKTTWRTTSCKLGFWGEGKRITEDHGHD